MLNGLEGNELSTFNTYNIIPIINDKEEYKLINQHIKKYKKLKFGVHIDTGLNRLGIDVNEFLNLTSDQNKIHILLSHLSSADEGKNNYNIFQNKKFNAAIDLNIKAKFNSLSNSMGIILGDKFHHDLVMPGISL